MTRETPNGSERATSGETPNGSERATSGETPNGSERATSRETPILEERATRRETPIPLERATIGETPTRRERTLPDGGTPNWSPIRNLVDSYYDLQRLRIAVGHRLSHSSEEMAADEHGAVLLALHRDLERNERALTRHLGDVAGRHPVGPWLLGHRGIGPILAAGLLATFDAEKAPHASSYWAFAGLVPGMRLEKGKKAPYSRQAKILAWKVADSFLKQRTQPYRRLYDEAKADYGSRTDGDGKPWTKGHAHHAALRKVKKAFLLRFWQVTREAVGLPVDEPYAVAILGHTRREAP